MVASCDMLGGKDDAEVWNSGDGDSVAAVSSGRPAGYSDLRMFELKGPVRYCTNRAFYDVRMEGSAPVVDTAVSKPRVTRLYFDRMGGYVTSKDELVKRDDRGRITYWRDRRPNSAGVHPGMLRDTLAYRHVSDNVLESTGMGEKAVTVYDNDGRIVGMCSEPGIDGTGMSAFNIYRAFDQRGNWTERVTVWTTRSRGGMPHVSYSVDRREITYYQD